MIATTSCSPTHSKHQTHKHQTFNLVTTPGLAARIGLLTIMNITSFE